MKVEQAEKILGKIRNETSSVGNAVLNPWWNSLHVKIQ